MINKQENYIKTAQAVNIGIWEINLKTTKVFWNTTTKNIFEVSENFTPDLKNSLVFFNRKNLIQFKSFILEAIENKVPIHGNFEIISAQKNIIFLECICQTEFIGDELVSIYGTFKDISAEQKRIISLECDAKKFSSVFSSSKEAIIIIDTNTGIISDCNKHTFKLTGYNSNELIGFHNSKLLPYHKRKEFQFYLRNKIKKNTSFSKETNIKTKDQLSIPVQVTSGKKFSIENNNYLICFFRNITKRKKTEEDINLLSLVASETTDSIIIIDSENKAIWANQAYMTLTDSTLEEIIGKEPNYFSIVLNSNFENIKKIQKAIAKQCEEKVIFQNYNKQKEKYWLELSITPVFDDNDNCNKFIIIGRDITTTKEKEIELKRLLEVTSQQNNKLLNFAHIVSHNIRSHTSNLLMVLDVIENTNNDDEKLSYIDLFKEGTEKLSETIENLNEVITIQQNSNIQKTRVNLKSEIVKTAVSFREQINITHSIPDDLTINVIPAYLDTILLNLLTNSIKYKSPDRIPQLLISHEIKANFTIIHFKDNGLGIDIKKNKHKLFGMYKTFHGNEDAKGIGLFMVKNQMEAMKGKIEVESKIGIGSTFKLYFNDK